MDAEHHHIRPCQWLIWEPKLFTIGGYKAPAPLQAKLECDVPFPQSPGSAQFAIRNDIAAGEKGTYSHSHREQHRRPRMNHTTRGFFGAVAAMLILSNFGWEGLLMSLPLLLAVPMIADWFAQIPRSGTNSHR